MKIRRLGIDASFRNKPLKPPLTCSFHFGKVAGSCRCSVRSLRRFARSEAGPAETFRLGLPSAYEGAAFHCDSTLTHALLGVVYAVIPDVWHKLVEHVHWSPIKVIFFNITQRDEDGSDNSYRGCVTKLSHAMHGWVGLKRYSGSPNAFHVRKMPVRQSACCRNVAS